MFCFHILIFVLLINKETIYIAYISEELYITIIQMFINKYIYKTILNANFKEKKDRFFICFFQNYKPSNKNYDCIQKACVQKATTFSNYKNVPPNLLCYYSFGSVPQTIYVRMSR